jgi:hypothetical protein
MFVSAEEDPYLLCSNIDAILNVTQIYHLTNCGEIFAGTLVEILCEFSQLDSLRPRPPLQNRFSTWYMESS